MSLFSIGEFGLIDRIRDKIPNTESSVVGIGDDCAIIPQSPLKDTLVSTDMLVEGTHFLFDSIPAYCLGWKSAAVNISDIAAMGGTPVATFLSLALPPELSCEWIDSFIEGYRDVSEKFGVALLGGDTTSSKDSLCINVAVLGECPHGKAVRRSAARVGDIICVTGPLGSSAAGLKKILHGGNDLTDKHIRSHFLPLPRVEEGLSLAAMPQIGAMMDISDGLGSDLRHILRESKVGARIDVSAVPLAEGLAEFCRAEGESDPLSLAISGGEDYELLFTCRSGADIPVEHYVIGEVVEGNSLEWVGADKDYTGYRHF